MRVCPYCHLLLGDSESQCPHDRTQSEPTEVPPVPQALHAKLSDVEPFARGRTGTCYLAKQSSGGYRGLLKVIPVARIDASERVRLKRELRKQTQLVHEGLPRIIDGGEAGNDLWLFREHVQGESLAQRIRRLGKLDVSEALLITAQVASALDELQRNGLLHRDVKPGHVLLSDGPSGMPVAKVIDAGLPGRLPSGSVFDLLGTPAYISPEQVAGKLVSFRSDLYALGCVLFEMLSGLPPFPDSDVPSVLEAHKNTPAPTLELELPAQVQTLLRAMLAKEPRQRPFSAQQVRRTLEPLLPAGAALPALGARPLAAAAARNAAGKPAVVTEEIELEEIDAMDQHPSPKTLSLGPDDIEEIDPPGPRTLSLSTAEIDALEVRDEAAAEAAAAIMPAPAAPAAGVQEAIEREPEPVAAPAISPAAAAAPAAAEAPSRRSVDFDVESLFDDDAPADRAREHESLNDAAPTQLYRMSDSSPPTADKPKPTSTPAAPLRDREGTVVARLPEGKKPLPLLWIAAGIGAVVLLIAFALRSSSHSAANEAAPSAAAPASGSAPEASAEHPSAQPAPGAADQPARAREATPAEAHAAQPAPAAAADHPAQPAAAERTAEPGASDTRAAANPGGPSAPANGNAPRADPSATGAQPAPSATAQPAAAGANPPAGAVVPANVAAANTNDATDLNRSAELTAANQAARAQPPSASAKLVQPQGSRVDRLAKAEEFKTDGRAAYQEGRYRDAAAAYEKATEQNPSDAGAFAGLAASRLALNDPNAAIAAYSRAVRLQPASSGFHAALGRAYLQAGDRARAHAAYEHALQLDPNNAAAKTALDQLK